MVWCKIHPKTAAMVQILKQNGVLSVKEISRRCKVSRATVFRSVRPPKKAKRSVRNPGKPRLLSARYERRIERAIYMLRRSEGNFSSKRLMVEVGLSTKDVSVRSMQRYLERLGYGYRQARKKGILSDKDVKKRLFFARKIKKERPTDFWKRDICFYLDGVSFYHKYNPFDQARATSGRIWRKKNEGLAQYCTAKGSHEGSGGRVVHFFVAISYRRGVILCEEYDNLDGEFFRQFVLDHFEGAFTRSQKQRSRLFLQDGDPSQNSALAKRAFYTVNAEVFSIPPRSPDLNPIENLFHIIKQQLRLEALEKRITYENKQDFAERIKRNILEIHTSLTDNLIGSMNKRVDLIIKNRGNRTKY